jgi:L-alanine-DL-glutamate epimerase-like enolase superfamily enzyme
MTILTVNRESWPIRGNFRISRGSKSAAEVVVAQIAHEGVMGRGECVPYTRFGETINGVIEQLDGLKSRVAQGLRRDQLQSLLPAGAARNAIDCAMWDLEAKLTGVPVWRRAGLPSPMPATTAFTISLDTPAQMARNAASASTNHPLLKVKLGGDSDMERLKAIRQAAPDVRLIVDANEAWTVEHLSEFGPYFAELGVELIEQPLPAGEDHKLTDVDCPVPLCADESCHDTASLQSITGLYRFVNLKLDKTGGLTEALSMVQECQKANLGIMIGCMVATSLAMAPATLLNSFASYVDLDGPLLLERDRNSGLAYTNSNVSPATADLWG